MQYTVNFFKADANGSFVAKSYTSSASQRPVFDNRSGVCTRDTKLLDTQMPQWENRLDSKVAVWSAYVFFFIQAASDKSLGNCALLLNDIAALRSRANNTSLNLAVLVKDIQDKGVCFLDVVMSYPRWVKYDGTIEVGGMFYYGRFLDEARIMGKQGIHVATVKEREAAFIDALVGKNGIARAEDYEKRNRAARGCIDDLVEGFHSLIHELGQKARCTSSAMKLNTKIASLVELLGSCGINDFNVLDKACNEAEDALADFCTALAAREDEDAKTPQEVILSGEQAKHLKTAATKASEAANNTAKPKRTNKERARGVTDKWIAQQFNSKAVPLIIGKDEQGKPIYEKKRGGDRSGVYTVGTCNERTVRDWIKKYPDESSTEPHSGFHAGMLTDKKAIEDAAAEWGAYWQKYAEAFYEWRKTNKIAPRKNFRYKSQPTIHGAEKSAVVY